MYWVNPLGALFKQNAHKKQMVMFLSKDTEDQLVCRPERICRITLNSGKPGNSEERPVI